MLVTGPGCTVLSCDVSMPQVIFTQSKGTTGIPKCFAAFTTGVQQIFESIFARIRQYTLSESRLQAALRAFHCCRDASSRLFCEPEVSLASVTRVGEPNGSLEVEELESLRRTNQKSKIWGKGETWEEFN
jgi:hypothetical protein